MKSTKTNVSRQSVVYNCILAAGLLLLAAQLAASARAQAFYPAPYTFTTIGEKDHSGGTTGEGRFTSADGVAVDCSGNVYVAATGDQTIQRIAPDGAVTILAGKSGSSGSADGTGSQARFCYPHGLAADGAGNIYVADTRNRTIRRITPKGIVTTMAGQADVAGDADGPGDEAQFGFPCGVAVDGVGNVYVADANNATIRKVTPDGMVTTLAGQAGCLGFADGRGSQARFWGPSGVAVDKAGNVYVSDTFNNRIRKITPKGMVTTLAGQANPDDGGADGIGKAAQFLLPEGLTVDGAGNIFVADHLNCTIRRVTPGGLVTTVAGLARHFGKADGTGSAVRFDGPSDVAIDSVGTLYVADAANCIILKGVPARSASASNW